MFCFVEIDVLKKKKTNLFFFKKAEKAQAEMASVAELQSVAAEAKLALAQADVDREQVRFCFVITIIVKKIIFFLVTNISGKSPRRRQNQSQNNQQQ